MKCTAAILCLTVSATLWSVWAFGAEESTLGMQATPSAMSAASPGEGKYGILRLLDQKKATHWASQTGYELPHWVKLDWEEAVLLDTVTVDIFARDGANLYAYWKAAQVELDDGTTASVEFQPDDSDWTIFRFDKPVRTRSLTLRISDVYDKKTYLGINEIGVFLDPQRLIKPPRRLARPQRSEELDVLGGQPHPIVYINQEDLARARQNAEATDWGKAEKAKILAEAARWLKHDEDYWLGFLPPPGACYAYGFTACPICGSPCGTWGGARCVWDRPRTVACAEAHVLPDAEHPDDGTGYTASDGRIHYMVGSWNSWVTEQWTRGALPGLTHAFALTGDEKYARRAAFFFDALASIYAESTSGSWDYPSRPPSGRFARPWYQVARNLVVFVDAYDLIYDSRALDEPSVRPGIEATFPKGPTAQQRAVGTTDAKGRSWPGMTRRENIDLNMMRDGAYYCYSHTFGGMLHNGHADYMRGSLAVGVLLGIPEYVDHTIESPFSIYAMLANNADRDGRYYETALGYAMHARNLYLTFVGPLGNWRSEKYPQGINLFDDPRMRSFYFLPDSVMNMAGHVPNFGDCGPDNRQRFPSELPFTARDIAFAEHLYAASSGPRKDDLGKMLNHICGGRVEALRRNSSIRRWLLYHADPLPDSLGSKLDADLKDRVFGSWFLGQKGIVILRDGKGRDAQGALLRYGPSLNHGDLDDLGLLYYGKGWQLPYEIGYGLGSTHSQVGWASQTVSHSLVTVNEASQSGGSGGSLHLFADLPSLKLTEADSPLSYSSQGVRQYRRTVALVGRGKDQYLIDLFRVRGGNRHDYGIGVQGQDFTVQNVELGPQEEGSLAGTEHAWGEKIGRDGDIAGYPNKPYWHAPPGNGYGFFYDMRRGPAKRPCQVDWSLGGDIQARFRVHLLPETETEVVLAKAPGLYPHNRNASYLMARRKGPDLVSGFAAVMEPYAKATGADGSPAAPILDLAERVDIECEADSEVVPIGVHLRRHGRDEYLFSAGPDAHEKTAQTAFGEVRWRGAALFVAVEGKSIRTLATIGAWDVRLDGRPCGPKQGIFSGRVVGLNHEERWVETDSQFSSDENAAPIVCFSSPGYSRKTAYRIYDLRPTADGTRISLGPQPMLLGQGRVHQIEPGAILSDVPHDYGRSVVGGSNPRFFDGKLVTSQSGASTHIKTMQFGNPTKLQVESAEGFQAGDTLYYYDVQKGDRLTIPATWEGRPK